VGVAVRNELGDTQHKLLSVPRSYLVAEALDQSPSSAIGVAEPLLSMALGSQAGNKPGPASVAVPTDPLQRLSEPMVLHFAAALRYLARASKAQDLRDAEEKRELRTTVARQLEGMGRPGMGFDGDSEMEEIEDSEDDSDVMSSGWSSPGVGLIQQVRSLCPFILKTGSIVMGLMRLCVCVCVADRFGAPWHDATASVD
jgi:hypothetical protein